MSFDYETIIETAFSAWEVVADISFVQVEDIGEQFGSKYTYSDIRIGGHDFDGAGGTLAHAYYAPENNS